MEIIRKNHSGGFMKRQLDRKNFSTRSLLIACAIGYCFMFGGGSDKKLGKSIKIC